jgi:hypothetical protein
MAVVTVVASAVAPAVVVAHRHREATVKDPALEVMAATGLATASPARR